MKKKILILSITLILISNVNVYAATNTTYENLLNGSNVAYIAIDQINGGVLTLVVGFGNYSNLIIQPFNSSNCIIYCDGRNSETYKYINIEPINYTGNCTYSDFEWYGNDTSGLQIPYYSTVYVLKGEVITNSDNANITVEYLGQSNNWVTDAWDVITDYFGFTGKPFSWIDKLKTFWKNRFDGIKGFWNNLFNRDNNGDITTDMSVVSPTPIPDAPTPIPYNTFVEFDSQNNTYIYKYSYVDENNTTIIVTSPPDGGNGTGLRPTSEPIIDNYYPADPLDVPRDNNMWSPQFTINLGDGQTLDVDMNTLNDTLIQGAEPYVDNVDVASDMFSVIPTDWWMLIGFIACIPLICAIISRFLG